MKLLCGPMFDEYRNEVGVFEEDVDAALECGYSLDTRTTAEYLADKAAYGASMAAEYMGES